MDEISIGADPEFSCFKEKAYIQAYNLYPRGLESFETLIFGYDGASQTGEIRPAPTYNPEDFANNIRKCLALGYRRIGFRHGTNQRNAPENIDKAIQKYEIELRAGSHWRNPLGGHIHVGIGEIVPEIPGEELFASFLKTQQKETIKRGGQDGKSQELWKYRFYVINSLDSIVGLGLKLIEDWERGRLRTNGNGYGIFSQYNLQRWGLEYRTPPSWIINPDIVKAVFELTQLAVFNIIHSTQALAEFLVELGLVDTENKWQGLYERTSSRDKFRDKFRDNWLKAIESLMKLNETKYLNPVISLIERKEQWDDEINLFKSWGIDASTFDSLEFVDPTKYYNERAAYEYIEEEEPFCPECDSEDVEIIDGDIVCNNCSYGRDEDWNETRVCDYENGALECPECGSTDVERSRDGNCLDCRNPDCRSHFCDYFLESDR